MARSSMFYCFMCFVVGACLGVFVIVVASCPQKKTLLAQWDAYKRADNARRRAAQRRRMERMAK